MNDYVFIKDPTDPETAYIGRTIFPAQIGKVLMFSTKDQRDDFITGKVVQTGKFEGAKIHGYNMLVVQSGEMPLDRTASPIMANVFDFMAAFMLNERILLKPRVYRKFINDET